MKGFNYDTGAAVDRSLRLWKEVAHDAIAQGGFVREDRRLGETFIHGRRGIIAEVYGINLRLKETSNG